MGSVGILDYIKILLIELRKNKLVFVLICVAVSFSVLLAGIFTPRTYQSQTLIYADDTNIIGPLLEGSTKVTKIDYTSEAIDIIKTSQILRDAALKADLIDSLTTDVEVARVVNTLRSKLRFRKEGKRYLRITYSGLSPERIFKVLNSVNSAFIQYSSEKKREESSSAFAFIDNQVKTYKRQLETAESALKDFKSNNIEGTESGVESEIGRLRSNITEIELSIKEARTRIDILNEQLSKENRYERVGTSDQAELIISQKIQAIEAELNRQRLIYTDSHPDIIALNTQLEALKNADPEEFIVESDSASNSNETILENPFYAELKKRITDVEINIQTMSLRRSALEEQLKIEYERKKLIAENQAELSELTRDYAVTKNVYEDMLSKRESARLSMTLDSEGQGVSYKIQSPPNFPLDSIGYWLPHYALAGPFLSLFAAAGLIFGVSFLDQKIRSENAFGEVEDPDFIPVLAVLPKPLTYTNAKTFLSANFNIIAIATLYLIFHIGLTMILIATDLSLFELLSKIL